MLQCRRWESAKNSLQHYRRRTPEQTQLYRVVYHGRDELARVWDDRFQSTYGVLRDEVLTTFDALEFLALLSCHNLSAVALREGGSLNRMSLSLDTTDGIRAEPGGSAQSVRRFSTTPLRWRREQYPQ